MISAPVIAALGASAVLVLFAAVWYPAYARGRDMRRRLSIYAGAPGVIAMDLGGRRRGRGVRRPRAEGRGLLQPLQARIDRAALNMTAGEVIGFSLLLGLAFGLMAAVFWSLVGAAGGFVLGVLLPLFWIDLRHRRRQRAFRAQLPDTVALLASTVRAGHSLLQGLEQVAREAIEPSRSAIEQVVREFGLGASQDEALERLAQRFPSEDLDLIVATINVQHQVGGSLAQSLDDMSATLRERQRIDGDIRALTAQQRYSAYVLALLPVFVSVALFLISRDYVSLLFEGFLRIATFIAAGMVVLGFVLMRRIASIDV